MIDEMKTPFPVVPAAPADIGARRPSVFAPERVALTIGLVLVVTMVGFEGLAVATVLPKAERDLGGLGLYGLVFVAYMAASLGGIFLAARKADRHGLALPLLAGLLVFALGLVIGGAAPTMFVLIAARGVQGLGAGAISTAAYAAIARGYDESLRPRMFAVLSSAWVVPGLVGPSVAGAVADQLSWRLVFLGVLPLVVLGGAFTLPYLRKMGSPPEPTSAGGPMALLREAPAILPAIALLALLTLAFFGAEAYLPLTLSEVRGQSATVAGLALTAGTLSWTAGAWVQERTSGVWDRRWLVAVGLGLVGVGIAILLPLAAGGPVWLAPIAWAVAGLGIGLAYTSLSLIILGWAPSGREGVASAAVNTSTVVGSALGTGIGAAIVATGAAGAWSTTTSVTLIFSVLVAVVLVAIAVVRRLR